MNLDTEMRVAHLEADVLALRQELEVAQRALDNFTNGYATKTLHELVLRQAAQALITKIEAIHEHADYKAVWTTYHAHGGRYVGPKYVDELAMLKKAIADPQSLLPKAN